MQAPRSPRPFAGTFLLYIVGSRTIPARTRREAPRARVHTEHTAKPPDRPDQHTERGCQLPQRPGPQLRWSLPRPGLQGPGGVLWRSGPL